MLKSDVDINRQNNDGKTSLQLAAAVGNSATVKLLLQHSANIYIHDCKGENALMHGAYSGNIDVIFPIF